MPHASVDSQKLVQHPACGTVTQRWLHNIATPEERHRAESLLSSLQSDTALDQTGAQGLTPRPSKPPAIGPNQGWTYTATRGALNQGASRAHAPSVVATSTPAPLSPRSVSGLSQQTAEQEPPQQHLDATTYHMAFHLAEMFPDLYAQAMAVSKAQAAPSSHGASDWGDSLKKGVDANWNTRFLRSVYDLTNAEVYPEAGPPSQREGQQSPAEAGFFRWLARQQTYYRSLLKAGLLPAVDTKLSGKGQHQTLDTLRQLHAVARPDLYISHSQAAHHPMRTCEDSELTALVRERTRVRTMGYPPPRIDGTYPTIAKLMSQAEGLQAGEASKVDIVFSPLAAGASSSRPMSSSGMPKRPSSRAGRGPVERPRPASAAAALYTQSPAGPKLTGPPSSLPKETFISKIPLKWAAAANMQPTSTYASVFGSLTGGASRRPVSAGAPIRYREVTAPIGAVNPVTAMAPARPAYPVPECFTTTKPFPQGPGDATMGTVSRASFGRREPEDVRRTIQATAEATAKAKAMTVKTEIPLGKNGICMLPSKDWVSDHHRNYIKFSTDTLTGDLARAAALKKLLNGPTASAGKLTADHPHRRSTVEA